MEKFLERVSLDLHKVLRPRKQIINLFPFKLFASLIILNAGLYAQTQCVGANCPGSGSSSGSTTTGSAFGTGTATGVPTILSDSAHGASLTATPYWINTTTGDTYQAQSVTTGAASWARLVPNYTLPLDLSTTSLNAAYSLYKLRTAYTGNAIRLQRASDTTNIDLGFVNGFVDLATAGAFCAGTTCGVTTWYDQSGNGRDATQATAAQMPYFAINTLGNKATLSFSTAATGNAVSQVLKYLSLSAGVSTTNPNFGVVMVGQPRATNTGATIVNLGTANPNEDLVGWSTQCPGTLNYLGFLDTLGWHCGTTFIEDGPMVYGVFENSTNLQTWVNEITTTGTKTSDTGTYTGGFIGFESSFSVPYFGDMSTVIIYSAAVTGATRTNLFNALYRMHGIAPQYSMNTWQVDGDSLAGGFGGTSDNGWQTLAAKLLNVRVMNTGTGGITCTTLDTQYAANIAPMFPSFGRNKILFLHCGVNDLVAGTAAATINSHIQSYVVKAVATGWTVVTSTVMPCNGNGSCTDVNYAALNALVRAGSVASGAALVCDFASDPNMGQASQNSSTTYYLTDHLHPNDLGDAVIAQYALACVQPLLNR